MRRMSAAPKSRISLYIALISLFVGVSLLAVPSILKRHWFLNFSRARFIESTRGPSDPYATGDACLSPVLSDLLCPGARYRAYTLSEAEKFQLCVNPEKPQSKALQDASGWFPAEAGYDAKNRAHVSARSAKCRQGQKMNIYLFSVENPIEFLHGGKLRVQELPPVIVRKHVERVNVDRPFWDRAGVAKYDERISYELDVSSYPVSGETSELSRLLDTNLVILNPQLLAMFPNFTISSERMSVEKALSVAATAKGYTEIHSYLGGLVRQAMSRAFPSMAEMDAVDFLAEIYRGGLQTLTYKDDETGNEERRLADLFKDKQSCIRRFNNFNGVSERSPATVCTPGYATMVSMSSLVTYEGFSVGSSVTWYEWEKRCHEKVRNPYSETVCTLEDVCGKESLVGSEKWKKCAEPEMPKDLAKTIISWVFKVNSKLQNAETKDDGMSMIKGFLATCQLEDNKLPEKFCPGVIEQLVAVGRSFLSVHLGKDEHQTWTAANGDQVKHLSLDSFKKRIYPYFVQTTVRQVLGIDDSKVGVIVGKNFTYGLLDNKTLQVEKQVSGKRYKAKGLGYFAGVNGQKHVCELDLNCMAQQEYAISGTCSPGLQNCNPPAIEGFEGTKVPARVFGFGERRVNHVFIFIQDFLLKAKFVNKGLKKWRGLEVYLWRLDQFVGGGRENCGLSGKRGKENDVDCDSPQGAVWIGAKEGVVTPLYVSNPFFLSSQSSQGIYNPADKVKFETCAGCGKRDFSSHLLTEPNLGSTLQAARRLQMNARIKEDKEGGAFPKDTDVLVPMFWVELYDSANDHQVEALQKLQEKSHTVVEKSTNLFRAVTIAGCTLSALAVVLLLNQWWRHRRYRRGLLQRQASGESGVSARM